MNKFSNLYEILGISQKASHESLRLAYRELARKHHPDVDDDPKAHERMAKINAAFEILIDPVRRLEYDKSLSTDVDEPTPKYTINKSRLSIKLLYSLQEHKTPLYSMAFTPDSRRLLSSSFDNELVYWNLDEGIFYNKSKLESGVINRIIALDNYAYIAAGCSETTVNGWFTKGKNTTSWRTNTQEWICCTELSSDGRFLAYSTMDGKVKITDATTGHVIQSWNAKQETITALAWSSDNRILATGSSDASVKLWRVANAKELYNFPSVRSTVTALAFSNNTTQLAVASIDKAVRVFSLTDLGELKVLFGHEMPIESLDFHPSSKILASTGRDGTIRLWDVIDGTGHSTIEASHQALNCVRFSPDGKKIVAGGLDKVLRVWDLKLDEK